MSNTLIIAPSLLSADFSNLGSALDICRIGGAKWIHVDVMDNHFVPNLTIGPVVVNSLRKRTNLFLDVHLMVSDPAGLAPQFILAGADGITIHLESLEDPVPVLKLISGAGKKAGISIKPGTEVARLEPYLPFVDLILVMSVEPGFGGQKFMDPAVERIREVDRMLKNKNLRDRILTEVDGGVNLFTGERAVNAGADVLVAGSAIFEAENPVNMIKELGKLGKK